MATGYLPGLSPEILKMLSDYYANPAMTGFALPYEGLTFQPQYSSWTGGTEGEPMRGVGPIQGWDLSDPTKADKDRVIYEYGTDGSLKDQRADTYSPIGMDLLKFAAIAAGLHGIGGLMTGAMGGGAGAAAAGAVNSAGLTAAEAASLYGGGTAADIAAMGGGQLLGGAGAAAGIGTSGNPLTPWDITNDYGLNFANAAESAIDPLSNIKFDLSFADPSAANFGYDPFASALGTDFASGFGGIGANTLAGMGGMAGLGPLSASSLGGLGTAALDATPSFWDKLSSNTSDFFTNPANILKTVATLGALTEGGGDGTVTQTKTLPPELQALLSGPNGLYGQLQTWMNNNPGGQNQTMRDAQTGMRNLLLDPNLLGSFYKQGAVGMGLLNTPVAPNPWLPKIGG